MRAIAAACGLAIVTLCGTSGAQIHAADLSPDFSAAPAYSEPEPQFEFGTGWYLRGDASFEPADHPMLNVTRVDFGKRNWDYALGGGIGYRFNSFLRADITGDYLAPLSASTTLGATTNRVSLQRYDGLANLYVDLGTWYGLTPYVGAGVGFRVFDASAKVIADGPAGTTVTHDHPGSETRLAWAAMAGVSYQIDSDIAVDLGYRHLDLGHAGVQFAATPTGYKLDHHFTEEQIRIGLRYMIF